MRMVVQVPVAALLYLQHSCSTPMWRVKKRFKKRLKRIQSVRNLVPLRSRLSSTSWRSHALSPGVFVFFTQEGAWPRPPTEFERSGRPAARSRPRSVGLSLRWTWHCLARVEGRKEVGGCLARGWLQEESTDSCQEAACRGPTAALPPRQIPQGSRRRREGQLGYLDCCGCFSPCLVSCQSAGRQLGLEGPERKRTRKETER